MPIPPNLGNGISCTTPNGIKYLVLFDGYSEHWAANASQVNARVIIDWQDRDDFTLEVSGYTTWDGASSTLNRFLPLECPLANGLWCDDILLVDKGMIPNTGDPQAATPTFDSANDNWPQFDWGMYELRFIRPNWWVRSDTTLAEDFGDLEQYRYCQFSMRYVPRNRKKPGYTFQYTDPTSGKEVPISEVGFTPDYEIEYLITWKQIPIGAVPFTNIEAALYTLNNQLFQLGVSDDNGAQRLAQPMQHLAFKGIQNPIGWYQGMDGNFYVDLTYVFGFKPGGWNFYQLNCQTNDVPPKWQYAPIFARNCAGGTTPPFTSTDFQLLFTPNAG